MFEFGVKTFKTHVSSQARVALFHAAGESAGSHGLMPNALCCLREF
jgi:hypothetical protein